MGRVRELDGLRAVAVTGVLAFHGMGDKLPVGWLGVDVFFVLSGYLITGLLLNEVDRGHVDLLGFYLRRVARLFPGLLLTLVLCVAISAPVSRRDAAISITYLADISRWQGHDVGALGHTWSLAIEEHFYVLWPVILIVARTRRRISVISAIGGLLSLATMILLSPGLNGMPESTYNAPHARMWELLTGCLLACFISHIRRPKAVAVRGLATSASAASALGALAGGWPARTPYLMICAVVATSSIILLITAGGLGLLAARPLPELGLISYGVYLFHYPIFVTPVGQIEPRSVNVLIRVTITLALAATSYWLIEVRVLDWARAWCRSRSVDVRTSRARADIPVA